jgi:hypothetical protein
MEIHMKVYSPSGGSIQPITIVGGTERSPVSASKFGP